MDVNDRKHAVLRFLEAMADADAVALRSMLTDDAQWWVPPSASGRLRRPLVGGDEVAQLAGGQITQAFQPGTTTWDVTHITAEDDRVAILMQRRAIGANGRAYDNQYHWLFRFEQDRIAEVWEIMDTALAFELLDMDPSASTDHP